MHPSQYDAYRATVVEVFLLGDQSVCLAVGDPARAELTAPFVVLTAWNPASRRRAALLNAADQDLLEGVLRERGCTTRPAVGRSSDGSWSEPSVAVWGLPLG